MNPQINPKATFGCLALLAIVILLVSYLATRSLNPLAVYTSDNILAKIIVSAIAILLLALLVTSLLQLLGLSMMRKTIERGTGKRAEDVICPGCGLPLIQYIGSHGMPKQCPQCRKWWHNGPACYKKDLPPEAGMFSLCRNCRSTASDNRDLFDYRDFTSLS